jgi:large subunit ribosomal protein L35
MGKLKTRKSAAKRFKVTGSGKITYRHQMRRHLRRKKSASNLRAKAIKGEMTGTFAKKIKKMMVV